MKTYPSSQSPFQKLNFGNSSQKTRKSRYRTFLFLSSFTGFLYFVPNILPKIVGIYRTTNHIIFGRLYCYEVIFVKKCNKLLLQKSGAKIFDQKRFMKNLFKVNEKNNSGVLRINEIKSE